MSVAELDEPEVQVLPQPTWLPRAELRYESLGGRYFPYPLVRAKLRGVETWLIVDTGASHNVMAQWLVDEVGISIEHSGQRGEGHAGEEVQTFVARHPHLSIDGWGELPQDEVLVIDMPDVFEKLGLGGVLSPQGLAPPDHNVVMDLPARELRLVPAEWKMGEARGKHLSIDDDAVCAVEGRTTGAVYLVNGNIDGAPARFVVDTGAARTDVLSSSLAARALMPRSVRGELSYTAGGKVLSRRVKNTTVSVGDVSRDVDISIMPGRQTDTCTRDGHLGLDLLGRCVLMLSPNGFDARCKP